MGFSMTQTLIKGTLLLLELNLQISKNGSSSDFSVMIIILQRHSKGTVR